MKRYRYNIQKSKMNKGAVYKDYVSLAPFNSIDPYSLDRYNPTSIQQYVYRMNTRYKESFNIDDLNIIKANYIIDTQGHIDLASLQDEEDLDFSADIVSLHDAFVALVEKVRADLTQYNQSTTAGIQLTVELYGYARKPITFISDVCYITGGGRSVPSGYDYTLYSADHELEVDFKDIERDNTYFNRAFLRDLRKVLTKRIMT